jgi:hypothetical protein
LRRPSAGKLEWTKSSIKEGKSMNRRVDARRMDPL